MGSNGTIERLLKMLVTKSEESDQQRTGLWMGIVEYVHDPLMTGRVKVRVPALHQGPNVIPTERLPWASRKELCGGGYDFGSFIPLHCGTSVWVSFLNGDVAQPVVEGAAYGVPRDPQIFGQVKPELLPIGPESSSFGLWKGASVEVDGVTRGQSEVPAEVRQIRGHEPTVSVIFKSWKGASITVDDGDGYERMEIIDRAGQMLRFEAPVKKEFNRNNGAQRGLKSSAAGTQLDYRKHLEDGGSSVELLDLAQQGMVITAREKEERVLLTSKTIGKNDATGASQPDMGDSVHSIDLSAGHARTVIQGTLRGAVQFQLTYDSQRGVVDLSSRVAVNHRAEQVNIIANRFTVSAPEAVFDGNLMVAGDLFVAGDQYSGSPEREKLDVGGV